MDVFNVLMLSECIRPVRNGVVSSVEVLSQMLQACGHKITLITARYPGYRETDRDIIRLPNFWFKRIMQFPFIRPWTVTSQTATLERRPQVIHLHHPSLAALVIARWAKRQGIPVVATYHTLYHEYVHYVPVVPTGIKLRVVTWWLRLVYRHCHAIIAPSSFASRSLSKYGVHCPVHIIPTGVALPESTHLNEEGQDLRKECGISDREVIFLSVGRLAQEKNLELLIEAFAQAHRTCSNTRLWVVGDGPVRDRLLRIVVASRLVSCVRFWGEIEHQETARFYAAADVSLCTSSTETQGLVVSESRAAGTPIIVVNEGGASETIEHNVDGMVVSATPFELSRVMRYLAQNREVRQRLSESCLERRRLFTPEVMAQQILSLYQSLVR